MTIIEFVGSMPLKSMSNSFRNVVVVVANVVVVGGGIVVGGLDTANEKIYTHV